MKLNKTLVALITALPLFSCTLNAQTVTSADMKERVYGSLFGEFYMPRTDKTESPAWNYVNRDPGYGIELGYNFNERWGIRAEYVRMDLRSKLDGSDAGGNRWGADIVYTTPYWSKMYLVGGYKRMELFRESSALNIGLGFKHFFNQNFGIYAEANRYQGTDVSYGDAGVKLGLTYAFGSPVERVEPTPAPTPAVVVAVVDSDGDGVPDTLDKCANTPPTHKVDATGCSIFVEKPASVGDVDIEVRFAFDSAAIPASRISDVEGLGAFMQRFPESTVLIEGHASNIGAPDYNMRLSERRAESVANMLKSKFNIASSRIKTVGYGVTKPRVEGKTAAAHAANQRIEAKVTATIKEPVLR